jgi:predicted  nucleic acid-binding Zn-ribbon protein
VNNFLQLLVRLQDFMQAVEGLEEKIAAVPSEVARLEKDLLSAQAQLDQERVRLEELQKDRRKYEMDLMGVESRIQKYESQLSAVKTNKEYQAILAEIETTRAERAVLDEKILLEMEETEKRDAEFQAHEQELRARERATEEGKKRLADLTETLRREKQSVETERDGLSATIPKDYLDPFLRVARQRSGLALVPVRDELCGGCHVRVLPTLVQQVRRATGLIACDSCKRFLYVPEDAAASPPAPDTTGEPSAP